MGLRLLSFMMTVVLLEGNVGFWPRCHHPWGKHHHGMCGRSILLPGCSCGGGERGPRAMPSGGKEAEPSFPA
jgi:hypothetical protein